MATATLTRTGNKASRACTKECESCGKEFFSWAPVCGTCYYRSLPAEERRRVNRSKKRTRRTQLRAGGSSLSDSERREIRESGPCGYCGDKATETDHVHSLAAGGMDDASNIIPVCQFCSRSKGPRSLLTWPRWDLVCRALLQNNSAVQRELGRLSAEIPDPTHATA